MASTIRDKYVHTATGLLGAKRSSMLQNTIHQRAQLSKSRSYCHNIPENMIMGIRTQRDATAVSKAFSWSDTSGSPSHSGAGRQFAAGPRLIAGQSGGASATGIHRQVSQQQKETPRGEAQARKIQRRPPTPIQDVISHRFQTDWIRDQVRRSEAKSAAEAARPTICQPFETRSSVLRTRPTQPTTASGLRQRRN
uniref:Uncharacterized protein n=1 Tax=Macrostomum lignano TaxID=282301 RepID=A0A1I8JHK0_9PLAT